MLETGNTYSTFQKLLIAVFAVFVGIVRFPQAGIAKITVKKAEWHVDSATIQKGYTFETTAGEVRLGMPSASVSGGETNEAWVQLKQVKKSRVIIARPKRLLSKLYKYAVYNTDNSISVDAPLWLSIVWDRDTDQNYVIKGWDAENRTWTVFETTVNTDEHRAYTKVDTASGIVGVFSKKKVAEEHTNEIRGQASWYDWYGAAMNDFPLGTRVEVENADTGAKVTTVVVSTGPFIPGRIIDLPREIFDAIGDSRAGVMEVIVRPLD